MAVAPLIINGAKALLVLGVGFGGHQVYWRLGGNYLDDGFFYFADKMSLPNRDFLKHNKVYDSESAITQNDEWAQSKDWQDRNSYHIGFKTGVAVRDKLNLLDYNGFRDRAFVYKVIKDHTLKLAMPCQSGTGWLLDFELPANGKYPTKWFVATNLHVINMFRFKSNPYGVALPITERYVNQLRASKMQPWRDLNSCEQAIVNNNTELQLYTERDEIDRHIYPEYRNYWYGHQTWTDIYRFSNYLDRPTAYTTIIKDPKLVYTAIDFLGPRYTVSGHQNTKVSYFKDFGVMEIDFENEDQARVMTNGTYDKYYKDKANSPYWHKGPAVDVFAPELMSKYDPQQLAKSGDRYYIGGYPGSVSENLSFSINAQVKVSRPRDWGYYNNYLHNAELTSSKLTFFKKYHSQDDSSYNLLNSRGQVIPGHADIEKIDKRTDSSKITWDGQTLNGWGYNYLIDNTFLGKGASGSMVLNQNGELLGLYRMYNPGLNYGFVEPLRASWVVDDKGKIILPGFDLLTGTKGQAVSYKSQLLKYKPNLNTYLKSKSWKLKN
ncbi:hypothetical protein OVS_00810 [Mycoplasma ovis str. Michigan]|uniref:DUF31 domain-containing protein n=1 Tax=Mycoplasma ovis str. Michigan TaxID=1415773 RepID=A0ABM5P079_9MOLU|nr:hypothetical protein [Mycoplasma ovis]AHC39828.1 hypothetical protein OVS_00810 [Mycoplasma ovis str. Michigan]